jgi:hypothetical protein
VCIGYGVMTVWEQVQRSKMRREGKSSVKSKRAVMNLRAISTAELTHTFS